MKADCKNMLPDMHFKPYRSLMLRLVLILLTGMTFILPACKKDQSSVPPQIDFINDPAYLDKDTSLAVGDRITVGVNASGPENNITFFQVSFDNGTRQILLDSGINYPDLHYQLEIIKSSSATEKWTFLVMDRERNKDSVQIILSKSEANNYGDIITYEDVVLGAQDNTFGGSFFSFTGAEIYDLESAYMNQSLIDIIYYYDQYEATLSSPNEADASTIFTGEHGLASWTVKNETRYDTTLLTPQSFEASINDSLLLAVYEPTAGKRKTKYVQAGMVISFKSPSGKIGLINVLEVSSGVEGSLRFSAKIQE